MALHLGARWSRWRRLALLALLALGVALLTPAPASAHERRAVGDYTLVVGFRDEPALEGQPNGIELRVTRGEQPVEGVERTLKADVLVGGQSLSLELRPRFRQPGAYTAEFVPTRSGSYAFRFTGTIDGQPIDERFESGPGRFNDVQAMAPLQFPDKVPSTADLQRALQATESRAATATTLAALGLAAGVAGLLLAGWALVSVRRSPSRPVSAPSTRPTTTPTQERL